MYVERSEQVVLSGQAFPNVWRGLPAPPFLNPYVYDVSHFEWAEESADIGFRLIVPSSAYLLLFNVPILFIQA